MKMKYYYLDGQTLINQGYPMTLTLGQDEPIPNYKEQYLEKGIDAYEFYCEEGMPGIDRLYLDKSTMLVRPATEQEKYDLDGASFIPRYGDYVKDGIVKTSPPMPGNMVKPSFNLDSEIWEDLATPEEIEWRKEMDWKNFYDREMGIYKSIRAEAELELIEQSVLEEVMNYIKCLARREECDRPEIMNNYR